MILGRVCMAAKRRTRTVQIVDRERGGAPPDRDT